MSAGTATPVLRARPRLVAAARPARARRRGRPHAARRRSGPGAARGRAARAAARRRRLRAGAAGARHGRAFSVAPGRRCAPDQANALRGRIGQVLRRGAWIPHLSLLDNLLLPQLYHTRRPYAEIRAEAARWAAWFGLAGLPTGRPADLPPAILRAGRLRPRIPRRTVADHRREPARRPGRRPVGAAGQCHARRARSRCGGAVVRPDRRDLRGPEPAGDRAPAPARRRAGAPGGRSDERCLAPVPLRQPARRRPGADRVRHLRDRPAPGRRAARSVQVHLEPAGDPAGERPGRAGRGRGGGDPGHPCRRRSGRS